MHDEEIREKVRQYIIETFLLGDPTDSPADEESFMEKGIIDSTGIMEVVSFLENVFSVKVSDDELLPENLDSIGRISRFVQTKRAS